MVRGPWSPFCILHCPFHLRLRPAYISIRNTENGSLHPLATLVHSGTTLDLPWYHRTVRYPPKYSPPPAPTPGFAPPAASTHLMAISLLGIQREGDPAFSGSPTRLEGLLMQTPDH